MEMIQREEGLEALASKYRQVQRRLENLKAMAEELEKELDKNKGNEEVSKELRLKLSKLAKQLREESAALEKLSKQQMNLDLDKELEQRTPEDGGATCSSCERSR